MIDPPLSSVLQPGTKIGEKATQILLDMIDNKNNNSLDIENLVLDTELLIRKSSLKIY